MRDLLGAWRMVRTHPFGVLLPAALDLALGIILYVHVGDALRAGGLTLGLGTWLAAGVIQAVLGVPLRGMRILAGATAVGHPAAGVRVGPLLVVVGAVALLRLLVLVALVIPTALVAVALVDGGWIGSALFLAGTGVVAAQVCALAAESVLAGAPVEVVVGGRSALGALGRSILQAPSAGLPRFVLLAGGRSASLLGGMVCGAGALPGYPLDDLAVLHHWIRHYSTSREVTPV